MPKEMGEQLPWTESAEHYFDSLERQASRRRLGPARDLFDASHEHVSDPRLRRTLYWTMRLMVQVREELGGFGAFARTVPGLQYLTFGFLDFLPNGLEFGVSLLVASSDPGAPVHLTDLHLRERSFPVWIRPVRFNLHAPHNSPALGTASCWARSRVKSLALGPGLLTAKHVVGTHIGAAVQLDDGSVGHILDVAPDGIDAALVSSPELPGSRPVETQPFVAPWADVLLYGKKSAPVSTQVTTVTDTMGILGAPEWPARITLARPGLPGDSGGLVIEQSTGSAVGLYMGEFTDRSGRPGGICQHAHQACLIMDMEITQ